MLITPDGQCSGSLSGGCLEEEVAQEALAVIATGVPRLLRFDTRKRFGCHGEISIFIERAGANFFQDMAVRLERRNEFALKTSFASEPFGTSIRASGEHEQESGALLHQVHPPLRLYIVGDGPDSAPIAAMAATLGWIPLPVPESEELDLAPDNYTAAVIKTHNYGRDFAALQRLLPMNLRYVGLMGPLRRRDQLLNHLLDL